MVRAADYRPGEWVLLKPFFAGYELLKIAKTKRTLDTDRGRQARSRCPLTKDGGGPGVMKFSESAEYQGLLRARRRRRGVPSQRNITVWIDLQAAPGPPHP
jgi:hypothetical protein